MTHSYYITPQEYSTAQQNGIPERAVNIRVRSQGWPKERAITEPLHQFKSHQEWPKIAIANGISAPTFHSRLKRGWSHEKAATTPIMDIGNATAERSRRYPKEFTDRAKALGLYKHFIYRVKHGWDMEKACSTPPMSKREIGEIAKDRSKWRNAANMSKQKPVIKFDETKALELYHAGMTDTAIAKELGVKWQDITKWRHRNGLPANVNRGGHLRKPVSAVEKL